MVRRCSKKRYLAPHVTLAHNLNALMKRLVLGPAWVAKRMKALRFAAIALPGRVIRHAWRLILRLILRDDSVKRP